MMIIEFLKNWGLIGTVLFLGGFMLLVINGRITKNRKKKETSIKQKLEAFAWFFGSICAGLYGGVAVLYLILLTKLPRILDYDMLNDLVIINTSCTCFCVSYFLYYWTQKILRLNRKEA